MARKRKQGSARKRSPARVEIKGTSAACLRQALKWFTQGASFTDLRRHGNVSWHVPQLVSLAVLWVWSDQRTLTGAFQHAYTLTLEIFGSAAVTTYQGLMGALCSYTEQLLALLWVRFHELMEQVGGSHWRVDRWLALAVDGTRISTPRTGSNERAFAARNFGGSRKAKSRVKWKNKRHRSKPKSEPVKPQIWLTLIWHMGLKMPWCWKTGPSTSAERQHLRELLETRKYPKNTLFCADAGFVGYELWKCILDSGHDFLIRVGGNVRLLRQLAYTRQHRDRVFLWPHDAMRKKMPPLELRLIEFQGPRSKVYLVTSVLSSSKLSLKQAQKLYRARWGVELQFRAFKQTFGRTKLRSRTSDNALAELNWSLVGLWLIQLFATKEQIKWESPPENSSIALALNVFQDAVRNWNSPHIGPREFASHLGAATKDTYNRHGTKHARYRPRSYDKPCATKPVIVQASSMQRKVYREILTAV